jgi:hypothetical protein
MVPTKDRAITASKTAPHQQLDTPESLSAFCSAFESGRSQTSRRGISWRRLRAVKYRLWDG